MRIRDWSSACALPIFKQVCNIAQGSTIDYTADGTPIREDSGFKSLQNGLRDQIQDACLAYARAPLAGFHRQPQSDDAESRRRMAAAILARLLFMPRSEEHTSELQSLMRISYAVFCLKKKKNKHT